MRSIDWFARNPAVANLLMILLLLGGLLALSGVRQETLPNVPLERIGITVVWPQATPEAVESALCTPVENAVHGVEGIAELVSEAREGGCSLRVDVMEGHATRQVLDDIRAQLDSLDNLPREAERPRTRELVVRNRVARVLLTGRLSDRDLDELAHGIREDLLARPAISSVDVENLPRREMTAEVGRADLYRYQLTFGEIAEAVQRGVERIPGGLLRSERGEFMLSAGRSPQWAGDYEALPVRQGERGELLTLGEVARVRDGFSRDVMGARFDGQPAVALDVYRVGAQDVTEVAREVKEYIDSAELPAGVRLVHWRDDAQQFRDRADLLWRNALQGLVLLTLMLAVVLSLRLAGWVALGIPVAMLGAAMILPLAGESLNTISLFAFILVLGIVVDDAVIVGESVELQRRRGLTGIEAAVAGAREVARPIFFAVLTTALAFAPLLFLPGPEGALMRVIPLVAIAILVLSLVESLWILPAHLSRTPLRSRLLDRSEHFSERVNQGLDAWLERWFRPLLRTALQWRYVMITGFLALILFCLALVHSGWLTMVLFSRVEGDRVVAEVVFPQGVPARRVGREVDALQRSARELAERLESELGQPIIHHVHAEQGVRETVSNAEDPSARHRGRVTLALSEDYPQSARELAHRWRAEHGVVPDALSMKFHASLMQVKPDIHVNLYHPDLDTLSTMSKRLAMELRGFRGVHQVNNSMDARRTVIDIDLVPAGRHAGLDSESLGLQVRQAFHGVELDRLHRNGREMPVMLRLDEQDSRTLEDLARLPVTLPDGERTVLDAVATVSGRDTPAMISHHDRRRNATLTAFVDDHAGSPRRVMESLEQGVLADMQREYPEADWGVAGKPQAIGEFLDYLNISYLLALGAIFFVLTVLFGTWSQPVMVMVAIPFGLVGSFLGHFLLGHELTLWSLVGVIAVSGVVVNDNLVLLDRINHLRAAGRDLAMAVEEAALRRFRPILLTSLTTFAGVTPLMLEDSAQARFLVPMAVSLAFGVLFATLISLVLVPSLMLVGADWRDLRALRRGATEEDSVEQAYQHGCRAGRQGEQVACPYNNPVLASAWEAGFRDQYPAQETNTAAG